MKDAYSSTGHGDPLHPSTTQGPQADRIQHTSVLDYLEHGKKEGKVLVGGSKPAGEVRRFIAFTTCSGIFANRSSISTGVLYRAHYFH